MASDPVSDLREAAALMRKRAVLADAIAKEAAEFLSLDTPEGPCCEALPACEGHGSVWGCERCGEFIGGGCTCWDGALKTARAYLGREDA